MIEKSLLVLMIVLVPSHRMEGGPKGRQLPVQGGGGDNSWHRAAEDDSHQDPAPQGRCAHHSRHSRLISINTPEYERHHVKAFDRSCIIPWTVHQSYGGKVAPGESEQGGGGPEDQVPMEEDGPEPLHPGRSVVTKQEKWDEESPGQDWDPQLVC